MYEIYIVYTQVTLINNLLTYYFIIMGHSDTALLIIPKFNFGNLKKKTHEILNVLPTFPNSYDPDQVLYEPFDLGLNCFKK